MAEQESTVAPTEPPPTAVPIGGAQQPPAAPGAAAPATPSAPAAAAPTPAVPPGGTAPSVAAAGEPPASAVAIGGQSPAAPKEPLTGGKVLANMVRYVGQDMKHGLNTVKNAVNSTKPDDMTDAVVGVPGFGSGPHAVLGAMEVAGAPITGAWRAVLEPLKDKIPQDTVWGQMAYNTLFDAGVMFGPSGVSALSKQIVPMASAAKNAARTLMDGGVTLTPGQLSGELFKRLEEGAKSVPILGHFIRQSEARSFDSWNVATVNRAVRDYGKVEAKDAREALTKAEQLVDAKYSSVKQQIPALLKDSQVDQEIIHLQNQIGELSEGLQNQFDAIINNRVNMKFGTVGAVNGAAYKALDGDLRELAASLRSSADGAQRSLGNAVGELRGVFRDALARQYPNLAPELREVDQAYGRLEDIWRASAKSATGGGRFTPGQYLDSLRSGQRKLAGRSSGDKAFVAGRKVGSDRVTIPMQEWAEDAQSVIGNKLPDSGTAERMHIGEMMKGLMGYELSGHVPYGQWLALSQAPLPLYTETGQSAVNALAKSGGVKTGATEAMVQSARVAAPFEQAGGQQ